MNISPILLLSIGSTFALLYGLIITFGWALTRKNRKKYHQSVGFNKIQLYDLQTRLPLNKYMDSVSLSNNYFKDGTGQFIKPDEFNCYIVEKVSSEYPKIKKGNLIFINPETDKIEYAFDIPNLELYR